VSAHAFDHDDAQHIADLRSQRHADADLAYASLCVVRKHAVNSNRGEEQASQAKSASSIAASLSPQRFNMLPNPDTATALG
jgi:hypothetical protein